ncbi:hypothetical protein PMI34_04935 [Pseudomonas sp. GM74]|nr:hypothetical protein PMI34_04935 [Pseudomonas sp. GM74]
MHTHPMTLDENVRFMRLFACALRVRLVVQNARRGMAEASEATVQHD